VFVKAILYICQNALGDVITTLPSIHFLARTRSDYVDVCVSEAFASIFTADPNIDRLIAAPLEWFDMQWPVDADAGISKLTAFRDKYDVVIDSLCISQTKRLTELLAPKCAIGIGFDEELHVYDHLISTDTWQSWSNGTRTASDCFADALRAFGQDYADTAPVLYVEDVARRWADTWLAEKNPTNLPLVALNPGAGNPHKYWPATRYIEVAHQLRQRGYIPLFTFGPKESTLHAEMAGDIAELAGIVFVSQNYEIQQLSALLQRCLLTLTNDCAVMHVSAAVGTRTLAIFGPSVSKIWFPYAIPWNQVVEREVACRVGCMNGCPERHCLYDIGSSEVIERITRMLPRQGI